MFFGEFFISAYGEKEGDFASISVNGDSKMQTRLLTLNQVCKAMRRSAPYIRALADADAVDSYIVASGWRAFPRHALEQIKAHETRKKAEVIDA